MHQNLEYGNTAEKNIEKKRLCIVQDSLFKTVEVNALAAVLLVWYDLIVNVVGEKNRKRKSIDYVSCLAGELFCSPFFPK